MPKLPMRPVPSILQSSLRRWAVVSTALLLAGCPKDKPEDVRGAATSTVSVPPSAAASAAVSHCAGGGGMIQDPALAAAFPRTIAGYCIDPHGEVRLFGDAASKPLDAICEEAFDGDCEVYKSFGLRKVAIFRYIDGAGSPGTIDVVLSQYNGADGAFGMFTKRVVSDADPAREDAPKRLDVPGAAAQGVGAVWLWKGPMVVEVTYSNEKQTPDQLAATSEKLLRAFAVEVAQRLPGSPALPLAASKLPEAGRVPLGIEFQPTNAFEVEGGGAGAIGYYRDALKRYRILSITRADADQAKDVLKSLTKKPGATAEKDIGEGAARLMVGTGEASTRAEWLVARKGSQIFGIGDEFLAIAEGLVGADRDKVCYSRDEKIKRLRALLDTVK